VLDGQVLRREYWATLDAQQLPAPRSRQLLADVRSVKLRFMDEQRNWQDQWPPANLGPDAAERALRARPIAVEVTLELLDWGVIVRLIEVAG
jgi:general secretion pathway protein J